MDFHWGNSVHSYCVPVPAWVFSCSVPKLRKPCRAIAGGVTEGWQGSIPALASTGTFSCMTAAAPESSTLCQGLTQGISNELKFLMQMNSSSQDTSTAAGSGKRARRSSGRRQGHAAGGEGSLVLQLHWKAPEFLHKRLIVVKVFPFSPWG